MVRRGRDVQEDARTTEGLLARWTPRVPDVLADAQTQKGVAQLEDRGARPLAEVAVLVEDAVVRQVPLVVAVQDLAARDDGAGVVEVPVEVHEPDRRRNSLGHPAGELLQRVEIVPDKARPQEQISGG
jgi:hypothetical protein